MVALCPWHRAVRWYPPLYPAFLYTASSPYTQFTSGYRATLPYLALPFPSARMPVS